MFVGLAVGHDQRWLWTFLAILQLSFWTIRFPSFAFFCAVWGLGSTAAISGVRIIYYLKPLAFVATIVLIACCFVAPQVFFVGYGNPWFEYAVQMASSITYVYIFFLDARFASTPPKWIVASGNFSYSLYVLHFPLQLLIYSLVQDWMGASLGRSLVVMACSILFALLFSSVFAKFFEDRRRFKPLISAILRLVFSVPRRVPAKG
jgi:peptidoglycan/LPS O-acetylase OafA/YrhL